MDARNYLSRIARISKTRLLASRAWKGIGKRDLTLPYSQLLVFQRMVAKIHNHRVKAKLKPALERRQISLLRPNGRHSVPSVQVFFEDVPHVHPQIFNGLILTVALRQQVYRRFSLKIFECQAGACPIHLMKPVQEWLRWLYDER
jgi:hypothetical protein